MVQMAADRTHSVRDPKRQIEPIQLLQGPRHRERIPFDRRACDSRAVEAQQIDPGYSVLLHERGSSAVN